MGVIRKMRARSTYDQGDHRPEDALVRRSRRELSVNMGACLDFDGPRMSRFSPLSRSAC
jgi:hypothetical protein